MQVLLPRKPLPPIKSIIKEMGIKPRAKRVVNDGPIAEIIKWLPKNSWISELLIRWFGNSEIDGALSFVNQAREGYGRSVHFPLNFRTSSGNNVKVWNSEFDGRRMLNYVINDGYTITQSGSVTLLCLELARAARRAAKSQTIIATDKKLLEKINLDGFEFVDRDLEGEDLSELSLRHTKFLNCKLENVKMGKCDLEGALFQRSTMNKNTCFDGSNIEGTCFEGCYHNGSTYSNIYGKPLRITPPPTVHTSLDEKRMYGSYTWAGSSTYFKEHLIRCR